MVNLGPSKGCHTCKRRRIKCDEGKPHCQRCLRSSRECGGYEKKPITVRFKHDMVVRGSKTTQQKSRPPRTPPEQQSILPGLSPAERDAALSFFLRPFASISRDFESSRGFFEVLGPVVASEHPSSAVSMAVTAIALRLHRLWREGRGLSTASTRPPETLCLALGRLQHAVLDPSEMKSPKTVLAALVLQFDETISAVWDRRQPKETHHEGAVALFMNQGHKSSDTNYSHHLVAYILHNEVSAAIREARPAPPRIRSWIRDDDIPLTPSFTLDIVGISVANVQHRFSQAMQQVRREAASPHHLSKVWSHIRSVDDDLLRWVETLPGEWRPLALPRGQEAGSTIVTYVNGCHVYPSIQIALIWNTWRCYRLILLKMALILLHVEPQAASLFNLFDDLHVDTADQMSFFTGRAMQELVDLICYSVPFHLGNRQQRSTLHDFTDPSIVHPSYHDLPSSDEKFLLYRNSDNYMTSEDHKRHVIVRGPWHILSPLGYIRMLLSGEFGHIFAETLRDGQADWIYEQLARGFLILDLAPGPDSPQRRPKSTETPVLI
ncbi:hypothetical protein B0T10DRAFT_537466 [Thelonectria olida]|uniref:Zn(2)-C6 fungal-type domain-containing protein n=1 Tax=Thelonectria olida TaxID=1576542 RepID=A0A9P8W8V7_9HYPO|nr:hypothetical protein B0T10DRAFT_537466 [Thelonectria olida]